MFGIDRRLVLVFGMFFFLSVVLSWGNTWIDNQITEIQTVTTEQPASGKKLVKKKRKKHMATAPKIDTEKDPLAPILAQKKDEPRPEYKGPSKIYDFSPATEILAQ